MEYKHFIGVLLAYRKFQRDISELYDMGFDLMDGKYKLTHKVDVILEETIKSYYGMKGLDWVTWFIYDSDWGERDWSKGDTYRMNENGTSEIIHKDGEVRFGAYDEKGNPICYSHESLWEYLEKNYKK